MTLLDPENVRIGITGALYKAPTGSTAPTDAATALDAAFVNLGYVSDDGISENWEDSVNDVIAWQNGTHVRSAITESKFGLELSLLETKGAVLEMFHRGSTMVEVAVDNFQLDVKPTVADPSAWVLDVIDGTKLIRLYIGLGEVVERGEISYANGGAAMYPITLRGFPDTNGNILQKFSNDVAWSAS